MKNNNPPSARSWLIFLNPIVVLAVVMIPLGLSVWSLSLSQFYSSTFHLPSNSYVADNIAGLTAPFIGVTGALLTFLAFFVQFQFNRSQLVQMFEATLFQLIAMHERTIEKFSIPTPGGPIGGIRVINRIIDDVFIQYDLFLKELEGCKDETLNSYDTLIRAYYFVFYGDDSHTTLGKCLDHSIKNYSKSSNQNSSNEIAKYMSSLCNLFRLLESPTYMRTGEKSRHFYGTIVRNMLSDAELKLLFIHVLSPLGRDLADAGYILKYAILKYLDLDEFLTRGIKPREWIHEYNTREQILGEHELDQYFDPVNY